MAKVHVVVKGVGMKELPAGGPYLGTIEDVKIKQSQKGQPYAQIRINCLDEEYLGAKAWMKATLQQDKNWTIRRLLEMTGIYSADDLESDEGLEFDTDDLIGLNLHFTVKPNVFNGRTQMQVDRFWPANDQADGQNEDNDYYDEA